MISQLSRVIIDQTQEYSRLQQLVAQAEAVQSTYELLDSMGKDLEIWSSVFLVIQPLIAVESVEILCKEVNAILRQIQTSQAEFVNGTFQQAVKLTTLQGRVERLRTNTKEAWKKYAEAQISPYRELTHIAERLPKMTHHLDEIAGYLARVDKIAKVLPSGPETVKQFHNYLARLETLLSSLEGLPSDVRVFLDKLIRGDAVFTDVTQTVFDWCRSEGLSGKLRITLG